jgi:hypothetical protein
MTITTECHERPGSTVIDGPAPDSPAGVVYRAVDRMRERAQNATDGDWHASDEVGHGFHVDSHDGAADWRVAWTGDEETSDGEPTNAYADMEFIASFGPEFAVLLADSWGHQADDMNDYYGHFHMMARGPVVVDERGNLRHDWTATVRAALKYLRETTPAVAR